MAAEFLSPPPRDFTAARGLSPDKMAETIRSGSRDTAMKPFQDILSDAEILAVARYVYDAFALCRSAPAGYHTSANGWSRHRERYGSAYPFVLGDIPVDHPEDLLSEDERRGRQLYRKACVVCHERDRTRRSDWRGGHDDRDPIAVTPAGIVAKFRAAASARPQSIAQENEGLDETRDHGYTYGLGTGPHDRPPAISDLTPFEDRGEHLYLDNCAYCHAADGTGLNWIGGFLEPHPPDLTDPEAAADYSDRSLRQAILEGLPQSSMPAFRAVLTDEEVEAIIAYINRAFLDRRAGDP